MKIIILALMTLNCAFAVTLDNREQKIIQIIDEELATVQRLSKQAGSKNPDLLLRIAELNLEKSKLWKNAENRDFLAIPSKKRSKIDKKKFFRRSTAYLQRASKACISITRRFPRYKNISEVYYILGFYEQESGKTLSANKFFRQSEKKASRTSNTKTRSQLALADNYYNQKKYKSAIKYYEQALNGKRDKWWTKDSFNLAWSYYRVKKYTKSIDLLRLIHKESKNKNYVDMSSQVERDIGMVFASANRVDDAIKFYNSLGYDSTDKLIKVASQLVKEGKQTAALRVLTYAQKNVKDNEKRIIISFELLDFYEKYARYSSHSKQISQLYKDYANNNLTGDQRKKFNYQVEKVGILLHKKVIGKTYAKVLRKRRQFAKLSNYYFEVLKKTQQDRAAELELLIGENNRVSRMYQSAYFAYASAYNIAIKSNDNKKATLAVNKLLDVLSGQKLKESFKKDKYDKAYEAYLKLSPKGEVANSVYQRLFTVYIDQNDDAKAEKTLLRYKANYPREQKTQEAMLARLMERARLRGDKKLLRAWITRVDKGEFKVSKKYALTLSKLLTSMQIDSIQSKLNAGNKYSALEGYLNVLKDPYLTKKARVNAKYNIAILYYEADRPDLSYQWSLEAMQEMTRKEVMTFVDSFLEISTYLFLKQQTKESISLASTILERICVYKTKKKTVAYKNAKNLAVATSDINALLELYKDGKRCKVSRSSLEETELELLDLYAEGSKWREFETKLNEISYNKRQWPKLIPYYEKLINFQSQFGDKNLYGYRKKQNEIYQYLTKKRIKMPVESIVIFASKEVDKLKDMLSSFQKIQLRFPEKIFQNTILSSIKRLEQMASMTQKIQSMGEGQSIVESNLMLIKAYDVFVSKLKAFVPVGKSENYLKGFKQQITNDLVVPYSKEIVSLKASLRTKINKNSILSDNNFNAFDLNKTFTNNKVYLMERGGRL